MSSANGVRRGGNGLHRLPGCQGRGRNDLQPVPRKRGKGSQSFAWRSQPPRKGSQRVAPPPLLPRAAVAGVASASRGIGGWNFGADAIFPAGCGHVHRRAARSHPARPYRSRPPKWSSHAARISSSFFEAAIRRERQHRFQRGLPYLLTRQPPTFFRPLWSSTHGTVLRRWTEIT